MSLLEADEVDCTGANLSIITGRAYEGPSTQQPQLPLLRQLLARSKEVVAIVPGPERVRFQSGWKDRLEILTARVAEV